MRFSHEFLPLSSRALIEIAKRRQDYNVTPEEFLDDSCCQVPVSQAGIALLSKPSEEDL
jgi:hypothetical protein